MSLNHPNIPRIYPLDMTSDETRVYYVVEIYYPNETHADLYVHEADRDKAAIEHHESGHRVIIYDVICPFNVELQAATDFVFHERDLA